MTSDDAILISIIHKESMMDYYRDVMSLIGNTPLLQLPMDVPPIVLAKLEMMNPGGSIKDRCALFMIEEAERSGLLQAGGTIVEASSGNQGIALAMIGKIKGYRVIITVPDRTSSEKIAILRSYGAEVHICPNKHEHNDPEGYVALAQRLAQTIPGAFMPNQYFNPSNPRAHYHTTGPEIWRQTHGKVTHCIAGAGSCGTISGVGRYLKEQNPQVTIIGVDAATSMYSSAHPQPYQVEGLGIDVLSDTFQQEVVDHIIPVTDHDAFAMTRTMASTYGVLVGISSGGVMHVAQDYARNLSPDAVVVLIFADSGRNYLSKVFCASGDVGGSHA